MDGELRRTVATAAGRGRSATGRRMERVERLGTVHEDVRRRYGSARPSVRQPEAQHVGQTLRGPGHGGRQMQQTRVRTGIGENGDHGPSAAGRPGKQRGGGDR